MVTAQALSGLTANLPIALNPVFEGDELAYLFGTSLPDAVVILALPSHNIVACNSRFLRIVDREVPATDPPTELALGTFLDAANLTQLTTAASRAVEGEEPSVAIEWRRSDGARVATTGTFTSLIRRGQRFLMLWLATPQQPPEMPEVDRRVEEQKSRALAAIKSSLRLYQLNEKIRRSTSLMQKLLAAASEEELFAEAARLLTGDEGLGYRDVTFVLQEEAGFRVVYSTHEPKGKLYPATGDSSFAQFVSGEPELQDGVAGVLFPLVNRKSLVGVGQVILHEREHVLLEESCVASVLQRQVLQDIGGIIALMADNLRLQREILHQSRMDALTHAFNRHHFIEQLALEVERAKRYSRPLSAVFIDIDDFKMINDRFGHLQGDEVLGGIGRLLRSHVRDTDIVCRYGGDEFVILLPETDQPMAAKTARKLLEQLQLLVFHGPQLPDSGIQLTASLGVSTLQSDQSEEDLLLAADTAVYRAKQLGRNRVEVF